MPPALPRPRIATNTHTGYWLRRCPPPASRSSPSVATVPQISPRRSSKSSALRWRDTPALHYGPRTADVERLVRCEDPTLPRRHRGLSSLGHGAFSHNRLGRRLPAGTAASATALASIFGRRVNCPSKTCFHCALHRAKCMLPASWACGVPPLRPHAGRPRQKLHALTIARPPTAFAVLFYIRPVIARGLGGRRAEAPVDGLR